MKYLVTFFTHFDALAYRQFLKEHFIEGTLMPVPRKVSSSCGTCITFFADSSSLNNELIIYHEGSAEVFQVEEEQYLLLHKNE